MKASPDLGLMTKADIHGSKTEQGLGRETLVDTQASLLEATGASTLTDESRQYLLLSVSVRNVLEYVSPQPSVRRILEYVLYCSL